MIVDYRLESLCFVIEKSVGVGMVAEAVHSFPFLVRESCYQV